MNKRRLCLAACAFALAASLAACGCTASGGAGKQDTGASSAQQQTAHQQVTINTSPDKYTWYVKDYYGMNAANCGYTALSGKRMDKYGAGLVTLHFQTADGTFVDPQKEDDLKQYVVCGQNAAPNTEIKIAFETDSTGKEYDNLTTWSSLEDVVLAVKKVGEPDVNIQFAEITQSPDKYTWYVRDYVGRNLADCGYTSIAGIRADSYGAGWVKLGIASSDGSFVDPADEERLASYRVVGQSISPNTEIKYAFSTDNSGKEYSNLVSTKSLESIELRVEQIK